jgi:urea transport system permease protein
MLLVLVLAFCHAAGPARADSLDDTLHRLTLDRFADTEKAVSELASGGYKTAPVILDALRDGRLYFSPSDHTVFYKDAAGTLFDAKTGEKATGETGGLKKVRLNNGVRSALEAAVGDMSILSRDPAKRQAAAEALFKSRDASTLGKVETAIGKEADAHIKLLFEQARAAILATKSDASEAQRLEAVATLRARGDEDALALLSTVSSSAQGSVKVKAAADSAIAAIQTSLALWNDVQNIWYGLSLGSVLLLAAIGLAITFGVMGIINMAHGEMVMLGAYSTFVVQELIRAHAPWLFDYSLAFAIPVAFLVAGFAGILIERIVIRFLYGRPLETLLATWGLSLMLQQAVRTIFGPNNREVGAPSWMSGSFEVGGLSITLGRMWIIVFTIGVFIALQLVLRATPFGLRMRAVTQNRRMASAMGIDTNRIDALAFGLGSGIAGIAGVALSQIDNVSPNLGQSYIIDSFLVVVFGGVGNLWGTLVAALSLGVANKFLEPFVGAVLGKILLLVFIILFIQKRPRGLFALKGRAVEA